MQGVTHWLEIFFVWGASVLPLLILIGFWGGLILLAVRRRRRQQARKLAQGGLPDASFLQTGDLPLQYRYVAGLGTGGPAPVTVGENVLRPSGGVRVTILVIAGMVVWYALSPASWQAAADLPSAQSDWILDATQILLPILAFFGVLCVFTSEARYDRDVLIVTRFLQRREYRWKHLTRVADAGSYDLLLVFKPGGNAKILKYSVGIAEFKDFALEQIRRNGLTNA